MMDGEINFFFYLILNKGSKTFKKYLSESGVIQDFNQVKNDYKWVDKD